MAPVDGQTITVVNSLGKIVNTRNHLFNAFNEAKSAYRERKAEVVAARKAELDEKRARRALKIVDVTPSETHRSGRRHRTTVDNRSASNGILDNHERYERDRMIARFDNGKAFQQPAFTPHADYDYAIPRRRSGSCSNDVDLNLAYGDYYHPSPSSAPTGVDSELTSKMSKVTMLLDEVNCLHHSTTAVIEGLQKNPEALASVALALAEISAIVSKFAPGMLVALKSSFPVVIALLASPQFLIAGGISVGVTVVALGGYKIIKKVKEQRRLQEEMDPMEVEEVQQQDELSSVNNEISRIEIWRRGIADVEVQSIGLSTDGEFLTPMDTQRMINENRRKSNDLVSVTSAGRSKKHKKKSKSSKGSKHSKKQGKDNTVKEVKKKKPSALRKLLSP